MAGRCCRASPPELVRRGWDVTVFHAAVERRSLRPALRRARVGGGRRAPRSASTTARTACGTRPARPRARRPADHRGVRRRHGPRSRPTSSTSTTCTTSARRCSTWPPPAACPPTSPRTTTGSSARAPTCCAATTRCAAGPGRRGRGLRDVRRRGRTQGPAYAERLAAIRDAFSRGDHHVPDRLARRAPHAHRPGLPGRGARRRRASRAGRRTRRGSASGATASPGRVGRGPDRRLLRLGLRPQGRRSSSSQAAQRRRRAACACRSTARCRVPMPSQLHALDRRGVVEIVRRRSSPASCPTCLARRRRRGAAVAVVGLRAAGRRRVPRRARPGAGARAWAAWPRRSATSVDGLAFDGGDVDGLARATDAARHRGRPAGAPAGAASRRRAASGPTSTSSSSTTAASARRASPRSRRPPSPGSASTRRPRQLARDQPRGRAPCWRSDAGVRGPRRAADRPVRAPVPLPHAADVEVRHQWPPDFRAPRSGPPRADPAVGVRGDPVRVGRAAAHSVDELWVPSEHVRKMYLDAGVDPDRVRGRAQRRRPRRFAPEGPRRDPDARGTRFLFVGGAIAPQGHRRAARARATRRSPAATTSR